METGLPPDDPGMLRLVRLTRCLDSQPHNISVGANIRSQSHPHLELGPRIDVIDDDASAAASVTGLMLAHGFRSWQWPTPADYLTDADYAGVGAVIIEACLPGDRAFDLVKALRERHADVPVMMLARHGSVAMCRRAFKSGAVDYLEKPVIDGELVTAVRRAVAGQIRWRERMCSERRNHERFQRLTHREREILKLVVQGLSSKEIASLLCITKGTVGVHRSNLIAKLEARSFAQLIRCYAALADATTGPVPIFPDTNLA